MVSHDALLDAVQPQPLPALTVTFPVDAAAEAVADSGVIENVHPGDCVIVIRCPAMVTLPERAGPVVAATITFTVPSPLPDVLPCSVIQLSFDTAVHSHSGLAVTLNGTVPPEEPSWLFDGCTTYAHPCDCVTVNVSAATIAVPVRERPAFGATLIATDEVPRPDAGATVSQLTLVAAVQGHVGAVVIAIALLAPAAATDCDAGAIAYVHPSDWVTLNV
jgi:hypothetical protein